MEAQYISVGLSILTIVACVGGTFGVVKSAINENARNIDTNKQDIKAQDLKIEGIHNRITNMGATVNNIDGKMDILVTQKNS